MFETNYCGMFLLFALTTLFAFVYQFVVRSWSYFSGRNVKYVRGLPLLGSAYKSILGIEPAAIAYRRCYDQFPKEKFIGIYEFGGRPSYLIRNPDLVKKLLITDFDHFVNLKFSANNDLFLHTLLGLQNTLSPAICGNKLQSIYNLMIKSSEQFTKTLKDTDKTAKMFNSRVLFARYANDIIASTIFGIELNSLRDTNNELFVAGRELNQFNYNNAMKLLATSSFPTLMKMMNIFVAEDKNTEIIKKTIREAFEARKKRDITECIVIDSLIKARDGQTQNDNEDVQTNVGFAVTFEAPQDRKTSNKIQDWTDDDIIAQCTEFFLGGFNTISGVASFMFHELAMNPDIQDKLFAEIDRVKTDLNGSPLTYESILKMKYLDMVVCETLRRWCPTPYFERTCKQSYTLDNSDGLKVNLEVDDSIFVPIYALHMDERYFKKPIKFDPERFSDENKDKIQPGTYLPFGFSSHNSFEPRFVVLAIKTLAFHLLSEFYIDKSYRTQDPLKLKSLPLFMDAERGFSIELRRRDPDRSPYKSQVFT